MTSSATTPIPAALAESGPGALDRGYRPHLDGLRAVAVYLVVAFHAGTSRFDGGYIGVDVFFVLSGYLVTQILLRDLRGSGSINLKRFYARRFRRLLPAALAMLVITAAIYPAVASPAEVLDAVDAFRAAFLYSANWFFIGQSTDYFGADINQSPVLHVWSLAVEEQFYLTWPLVLTGLYMVFRRAGRRQWSLVRGAVVLGGLGSLGLTFHYGSSDLNRAYFGTDARAYQLLAGAMLALTPRVFDLGKRGQRWLRPIAPVALLAIIVIGSSWVTLGPIGRGVAATIATVSLLVAIESTDHDLAKGLLSRAPIVYLGRISYGTYLWQWPVILIAVRTFDMSGLATLLIGGLVATGLASLSYQLLEQPIRQSRRLDGFRGPVIALGIATTVVGGLVIAPALLDEDEGSTRVLVAEGTAQGATRVPSDLDWRGARTDRPDFPDCSGEPVSACQLERGKRPSLLVVGDSHARMLLPAFERLAQREGLALSVAVWPVCPWQASLYYPEGAAECRVHKADWYDRIVPELDPDIVFLASHPYDDPVKPVALVASGGQLAFGTPEASTAIRDATTETIEQFRADGRRVVIVEPIPMAPNNDPLQCLSEADFLDECRYVARNAATPIELFYRELAQDDDVYTLNLDNVVCPYLPICDPVVDGLIVKRDLAHLTGAFSETLTDDLRAFFRYTGLLETS